MSDIRPKIQLNDGREIPTIGYGTWLTPAAEAHVRVRQAIEAGYRHIDCAAVYDNEPQVGQGIRESNIPRSELFVTSKVWNTHRGFDQVLRAFEKTITDLRADYLDLYLVHWPANETQYPSDAWRHLNAATWRAMERLHDEGAAKSIGVSNFLPHHLDALALTANIPPAVNQIEFHPGYYQSDLVQYCFANSIAVEAWSPLGSGRILNDKTLADIANHYNRTIAQLCIRWVLQHGIIALPKSLNPARMQQNLSVDDFVISDNHMRQIDQLPEMGYSGSHPDKVTF